MAHLSSLCKLDDGAEAEEEVDKEVEGPKLAPEDPERAAESEKEKVEESTAAFIPTEKAEIVAAPSPFVCGI